MNALCNLILPAIYLLVHFLNFIVEGTIISTSTNLSKMIIYATYTIPQQLRIPCKNSTQLFQEGGRFLKMYPLIFIRIKNLVLDKHTFLFKKNNIMFSILKFFLIKNYSIIYQFLKDSVHTNYWFDRSLFDSNLLINH